MLRAKAAGAAKAVLCVALAFSVSACSGGVLGGLIGTGSNPTPTFDLSAPTNFGTLPPRARGLLAVEQPTALQILDTEKIVISPNPGEVAYLSDAQWVDRLPKLMQARIVQSFENSTRIRAVAKTQDRVSADYVLVIDVRQFGIVAYDGPQAVVELSVKIVYQRGGRIAAGTVLTSRVAAGGTSGQAATLALDQAFSDVLVQMVKWTSRRI
ncbi:MAG: ABC-type transport auxiliary lipoprotein family protein [Xanthobacteraceae bacterium]|nr:ABC-type transport auxiliary lipoprotein family protein [Xanthobacteraceae bacterium]